MGIEINSTFMLSPEQREERVRLGRVVATWLSTLSLTDRRQVGLPNGETVPLSRIADVVYGALKNGEILFAVDEKISARQIGLLYPHPQVDITQEYRQFRKKVADTVGISGTLRGSYLESKMGEMETINEKNSTRYMGEIIALQVNPSLDLSDCMQEAALKGLIRLYIAHLKTPTGFYLEQTEQAFEDYVIRNQIPVARITVRDPVVVNDPRLGPFPQEEEL